MTTGPGRYALPSRASFVQDFFNGNITLDDDIYTRAELIANHGYSLSDFSFDIVQYETDPNSADYGVRTYVLNSTSFVISDTTEFVVDGSSV